MQKGFELNQLKKRESNKENRKQVGGTNLAKSRIQPRPSIASEPNRYAIDALSR
jgi:hypothetical protein